MKDKAAGIKMLFQDKKLFPLVVILFFLIYLLIGLAIFRDYGMSTDEPYEREHGRIAYKYINEKLLGREIDELSDVANLPEYKRKYYGVAITTPLIFVEEVFNFELSTRHIFLIRHLYNFLVCFAGYICFYLFLKKTLKDEWLALLGTILISLYPRFYAYQFYDVKNMLFMALNALTLLTLARVVEKCNFINILIFSFCAALATNQRIMGVLFPVILIGYFIVTDISMICAAHKDKKVFSVRDYVTILKKYLLVPVLYLLCWIVLTPASWENPLQNFYETFVKFSYFYEWKGTMIFCGRVITGDERPWYYLFVWFAISIPLMYLILFIVGHVYAVVSICKSQDKWNDIIGKHKWLMCSLLFFWGSVWTVIILNARIYEEWRHMFFVFVPFCCIAIYGLKWLLEIINKKIVYGVFSLCLLVQVLWIVQNHPHQFVYFNAVGKHFATNFDRDSWCLCNSEMMLWILENDDDNQVTISLNPVFANIAMSLLSEDEKKAIIITNEDAKYIIEDYNKVVGNNIEYDGYEEIYSIWVDGFRISSVFRRVDE